MDPFFAFAAEFWWLGPAVIAGGAASFAGIRYARHQRARTLEYAAARHELTVARTRLLSARAQAKNAQATMLAAKSARQSGHGSSGELDEARRAIDEAQRELRSAQTALRGRRLSVKAARATLRGMPHDDEHLPLPRLIAEHDAVLASWVAYETDPEKAIAFPTMSDARVPATAALLTSIDKARWLRPPPGRPTLTPEEFARYRAAVTELGATFHAAEAAAWRAAGASGRPPGGTPGPGLPPHLRGAWEDLLENARAAAVSAAAAATESARDALWHAAKRSPRTDAHRPEAPPAEPQNPSGATKPDAASGEGGSSSAADKTPGSI
ncbi:TolC family protein [Microbacterium sp. LRZ72]|uniref:TolC family protein n=1 Tax=Microbacterium sp. LRZ72 TaxID=2942481 RepID=UPI0029B678AA|nr:TolC family protein [Microbacterium sp. LRZ72]MDX2376288.1 TolC family protein [Microbacterium sp. LRZ72]